MNTYLIGEKKRCSRRETKETVKRVFRVPTILRDIAEMSFQLLHLMIHGSIINSEWPHTIFSESSTCFPSPSPATIKLFGDSPN